jgi:hypothetical protein
MVNSRRLCNVNNEVECDAVLNLTYYFEALLLSRHVNSRRLCNVNNEVDSVTPCLN